MAKQILIVDDENSVTRYLYRTLRDEKYALHIANCGKQALKVVRENHIDMVITDLKMPGMTGYELLNKIKELYPEIIRVVLSGDSEESRVIKIVSDTTACLYLIKPISNEVLREQIENLFSKYSRKEELVVKKL